MFDKNFEKAMASFFRAMGDETRISILQLLQNNNELNVNDICKHLKKQQHQISHHLACLRNCGLVRARREGKMVFYSLNGRSRIRRIVETASQHVKVTLENILRCKEVNT